MNTLLSVAQTQTHIHMHRAFLGKDAQRSKYICTQLLDSFHSRLGELAVGVSVNVAPVCAVRVNLVRDYPSCNLPFVQPPVTLKESLHALSCAS